MLQSSVMYSNDCAVYCMLMMQAVMNVSYLQANEWNDAIESVLDWIPLAEHHLVFRSVPTNEQHLLEFINSHKVCCTVSFLLSG